MTDLKDLVRRLRSPPDVQMATRVALLLLLGELVLSGLIIWRVPCERDEPASLPTPETNSFRNTAEPDIGIFARRHRNRLGGLHAAVRAFHEGASRRASPSTLPTATWRYLCLTCPPCIRRWAQPALLDRRASGTMSR